MASTNKIVSRIQPIAILRTIFIAIAISTVALAATPTPPPTPYINSATISGGQLTLTGSNFRYSGALTSVLFGSSQVVLTSFSNSLITGLLPNGLVNGITYGVLVVVT